MTEQKSMIEKFYAIVDKENKIVLNTIQELPKNWHNICGLNLLSDPELKELGWINVTDPDLLEYEYSNEWLNQCRLTIIDYVANIRWEAQTDTITFQENRYKLNEATINALNHKRVIAEKNSELTFNWKTLDWVDTLSSSEIISLTDAIHTYTQECFDIEYAFSEQLKSINTLEELLSANYTLAWPTTSLT